MNRLLVILFLAAAMLGAAAPGANSQTQIRYLSGTGKDDAVSWDFFCTAGRKSGVWTKIAVPSCWEQQGFGAYNYGRDRITAQNPLANEQGKYRLQFAVPTAWKAKTVRLVFDGVMTDTEVWINGQPAGPVHQGGFYRFKYDITRWLKFGEPNLLEVTVSKVSANESVNRAERFGVDYWVFGGIFRPVYLEALPARFIDRTAIDARADGNFSVETHLAGINTPSKLTAQILDARGLPVGPPFSTDVSPGQDLARLQTKIPKPRLWTAETPNLYRVVLILSEAARPLHTTTERFGFRTFEVRAGDGLYLNGQKIILKGANRHSFWPESGRTLSRQISYDDVRLIKQMNMNAVRMSHYPPDAHFLDACDELGLYVLDELGGWQRSYDTPTGRQLIGEMVQRDVNHPSILFWDNGNEGGWNSENDGEFAKWDPQKRTVLHPWETFNQVNTSHYKKHPDSEKFLAASDIYMPTEFLHGLYDGGGGAGLSDYWEMMRRSKVGAGGFIWALVDECVVRTDQNGRLDCAGNQGPDGIVGPHREKEGSFNTVREIWSPVQMNTMLYSEGSGSGPTHGSVGNSPRGYHPNNPANANRAVFHVENRYDFTNLNLCSFEWQLARFPSPLSTKSGHMVVASGTIKGPNVAPHAAGEFKLVLPEGWRSHDVLYMTAKDPGGRELWTWWWSLDLSYLQARAAHGDVQTHDDGTQLTVQTTALKLRFQKQTGKLVEVTSQGRIVRFGNGPRFIAFRRNDRKYEDLAGQSSVTDFTARKEGANVLIETNFKGALQTTLWRISPDGNVELEYEYSFDGLVDMIGINFDLPESHMKSIRWLGMGPSRVWQNRMEGTRLDVWRNGYNNTTPGQSWNYPEFKGYFRNWRWAAFETDAGKIVAVTTAQDSFLGLYKPQDGKDGLLDLPDIGIAFLDVIPAMRNKFHTTDEIGPQSRPRQVSGTRRVGIQFRFLAQ